MAKKITGYIKLQVPAGAANPSPPIGPALGQRGLNIMEFCKAFNAQTQNLENGAPIPVTITVYADRSFSFELRTPPVRYFIKKAAKLERGSKTPGRETAGSVTRAQLREIAEQKMKDLNATRSRCRHAHDRRLGALDGPRRVVHERTRKASAPRAKASIAEKLYPLDEAVQMVKDRAVEVRRDRRGGD